MYLPRANEETRAEVMHALVRAHPLGTWTLLDGDDLVTNHVPFLLDGAWGALGAFEIVAGVLLIVPAATGWWPVLMPWAAVAIVLESVALVAVYGRVSLAFGASNPLVFAVGMGLGSAVIAVGRFVWSPLG